MDTQFSTIVSLLPFDLVENKPGLNPNEFIINRAIDGKIGLTIIPADVFYLVNPDPLADAKDVRNIKVPVPSLEVAQALINDYTNSLLAVEPPDAMPGLLALKGDYTDRKEVASKFVKELMSAQTAQNRWFKNLVDIADDIWSKTHSPVGISDLQKSAGRMLSLNREWLSAQAAELVSKCPVCRNAVNDGALKCVICGHILNKVEYDKLMLAAK